MTRVRQTAPPVLIVALIAGVAGNILGCTNSKREHEWKARDDQPDRISQNESASQNTAKKNEAAGQPKEL